MRKRKDKGISANLVSAKRAAMLRKAVKAPGQTSNPFDVRGNKRQKHVVLNRKSKGHTRNLAKTRASGVEKRKRVLLSEFGRRNKANVVEDKRFGEKDASGMAQEDKALLKFKKQRQKKDLYNLKDSGSLGEGEGLTHMGQSLSATLDAIEARRKKFGTVPEYEERDEDKYDANKLMRDLNESKGSGGEATKTKREIMEDLIRKSKLFKAERQMVKEQDEEERERLDGMFQDLLRAPGTGLEMRKTRAEEKEEMMKRILEGKGSSDAKADVKAAMEPDAFDVMAMEIKGEARAAAASNRSMTAEEIAKTEREELERLEKEREARMRGGRYIESDDDEADEDGMFGSDADDDDDRKRKRRKKRKKTALASGDELMGNLLLDPEYALSSDDDEEEEEGSAPATIQRLDEVGEDDAQGGKKGGKEDDDDRDRDQMAKARRELPFLLDCPETHGEFVALLERYPDAPMGMVLERVLKTNSVHIAAENRAKLVQFCRILLDHLVLMGDAASKSFEKRALVITKALFFVCHDMPQNVFDIFTQKIVAMQRNLRKQLILSAGDDACGGDFGSNIAQVGAGAPRKRKAGGHKDGARARAAMKEAESAQGPEPRVLWKVVGSDMRCWPSPGELAFFRLISRVFPTTDFRHPIVSATQLLLGQYLSQCPLRGSRDIVACVATAELLLTFTQGASRLAPEAVVALEAVVGQASLKPTRKDVERDAFVKAKLLVPAEVVSEPSTPQACFGWLRRGLAAFNGDLASSPTSLHSLLAYDAPSPEPKDCAQIADAVLQLCSRCAASMGDTEAFDAILGSMQKRVVSFCNRYESQRASAVRSCLNKALSRGSSKRRPLQLQESKTNAIVGMQPLMIAPDRYQWSKDKGDPNRERAEAKKLKRQIARERKAVVRELRKDGQFISEQRDKEKADKAAKRKAEHKANLRFMEEMAATVNQAVKAGAEIRGGGANGVNMRGRRRR